LKERAGLQIGDADPNTSSTTCVLTIRENKETLICELSGGGGESFGVVIRSLTFGSSAVPKASAGTRKCPENVGSEESSESNLQLPLEVLQRAPEKRMRRKAGEFRCHIAWAY